MTSEALKAAVGLKIKEALLPNESGKVVLLEDLAQSILQLIATSLPEKKEAYYGGDKMEYEWGYNQAIDDFLKLLGGGDNG